MKKIENEENGCLSFFGKPLLFIGLVLFLWCVSKFYLIESSKSWIEVEAEIEELEAVFFQRRRGRSSRGINVKYKYIVDNQTYLGDRILLKIFNRSFNSEGFSEIYDKLNRAKIIKIYYNPQNHSDAVIINTFTNKWYQLLYITILWNSFILGLWLFEKHQSKIFLFIPILVFIFGLSWRISGYGIDTAKFIKVVEEYPPDHCKFFTPFKEHVYMYLNNERMEGGHKDFTPKSSIGKVEVLEKEMQSDSLVTSVARVDFYHLGEQRSKKFKMNFQQFDKCNYRLLDVNAIDSFIIRK